MVPDSLTSDLSVNTFLWGSCDEEATNSLKLWAQFIHEGETAVSNADSQLMLKLVVNLPLEVEYIHKPK